MKYVQVGILISLVAIAGLLLGIYRSQEPAEPPAPESLVLADEAQLTPAPETVQPEPDVIPKASPLQADPPTKARPARAAKPTPVKAPEPPVNPLEGSDPPEVATKPEVPAKPDPALAAKVSAPAAPELMPEPAPEPRVVTLPAGLDLPVRLVHSLSSDTNLAGDTFYATLEDDLIVDNLIIARKNARIEGRVVEAQKAGRVKGVSLLAIELVRLNTADGQTIDVFTNRFTVQGQKSRKDDAKKVGIAAGIGAAIGAIAGGGKGAAVGAAAGAGAGGGQVLLTRGKTAVVRSETPITFRLVEPVEIVESL